MTDNDPQQPRFAIDDPKLRHYILGWCSPQEVDEIEENALGNNDVLDFLSAIEDELADEYVTGELNEREKASFEWRLLGNRGGRLNLRLSEMLLNRHELVARDRFFGGEVSPADSYTRSPVRCRTSQLLGSEAAKAPVSQAPERRFFYKWLTAASVVGVVCLAILFILTRSCR
jgi:hypothetical protein